MYGTIYVEAVRGQPVRARVYDSKAGVWEVLPLPSDRQEAIKVVYNYARPRGIYWLREINEVAPGVRMNSTSVSLPEWGVR